MNFAANYGWYSSRYAHLYSLEKDPRGPAVAEAYAKGEAVGWRAELAKDAFSVVSKSPVFKPLLLDGKLYRGKKSMLYEACRKVLGRDTPNYPQEIGDPFAAGTMVLMADGTERPIEQVLIGDLVLNHKLKPARVTNTIKKRFTGRMVKVTLTGWPRPVSATETHHGMVVLPDGSRSRRKFGELKLGDMMSVPTERFTLSVLKIESESVADHPVYCITTEGEFSAVFNGVAQYQCVSFGGKNTTEYLQCVDIAIRNAQEKWRPIFPPYYYHTSRMKAGGGQIPANEDGSLGSWLAQSAAEWGAICSDEPGVPQYSGRLAKQWGGQRDVGQQYYDFGRKHLATSIALIRSWDDLVAALVNGYPCTTASNVGYEMLPGSDGLHRRGQPWPHQMAFIGVGFSPMEYAIILNNWGDNHGKLKDFDDGSELPPGVLRVSRRDAEAHIRENETFAWSQFDGFPEQADQLERALFKLVN